MHGVHAWLGHTSGMKLYIGNKNYSSWSMRPWVLMREFGIAFEEIKVPFGDLSPQGAFKTAMSTIAPTASVPVLVDDAGHAVWDSLAIMETVADRTPHLALWPTDPVRRARARSLSCEMHSSFGALRSHCPVNIEASLPEVGARLLKEHPAIVANVARMDAMWCQAVAENGGPFLMGTYSIADAMYAPVVARVRTYGLPLSAAARAYADRLWATRGVSAWVADALAEHDFVPVDEPYRTAR
jgi:glutathione S-transferase